MTIAQDLHRHAAREPSWRPDCRLAIAAYDDARRVWNAMIDKRPAVIARCRGAVDVMTAVKFARNEGLSVAVRGGAHNVAGKATCDDGIVIDLSEMKGLRVDPVARTARAEPGLRWGEFDRETQAFGLATTGGTIGDTGIAGLTLGGGFGWLGGRLGMTVDNLLSVDIVLANGELVHASATEQPGPLLGRPRRRQQLRRRHVVRVPAAPRRTDDRRRPRDPPVRARGRGPCASTASSFAARPTI